MENERKVKRPRISDKSAASRDGNTEKFERVEYNRSERPAYSKPSFNNDRPTYNREGGDRPAYNNDRPAYNRDGGDRPAYNREARPAYNNDRPAYNRDGGDRPAYNREARPAYNNDRPAYNREGGDRPAYNREARPAYNNDRPAYNRDSEYNRPRPINNGGERSYNNDRSGYNSERSAYNKEGGYSKPRFNNGSSERNYNSDRPYNRDERSAYNNDRPAYNKEGGYSKPRFNSGGERSYNNGGELKRPIRRTDETYDPTAKYSLKKRIEYDKSHIDINAPLRLNKFLANAGTCSRREADQYIQQGAVKVNGVVITELGTKITRADEVTFNDKPVSIENKIYVLLNKPKDCVTTADDPQGRLTVMDIVRNACTERIYPVGRLDRNTTGVLLLTNDGDLASKLTHPKFIKKKIYHVWTDKDITEEDMQKIANGIILEDGPIQADAVSYANEIDKNQVGIEIHSGRNRIVRRIFESLGYRVVKLDRVYFAGLTKKNVQRGRWRYLTQQEVNILQMGAFE